DSPKHCGLVEFRVTECDPQVSKAGLLKLPELLITPVLVHPFHEPGVVVIDCGSKPRVVFFRSQVEVAILNEIGDRRKLEQSELKAPRSLGRRANARIRKYLVDEAKIVIMQPLEDCR